MLTKVKSVLKVGLLTIESHFKPKLISKLGEGGQAKVYKATFHGEDVAMKYIPLDKVKDEYEYKTTSYGCNEFYVQEKFQEMQHTILDSILPTDLTNRLQTKA